MRRRDFLKLIGITPTVGLGNLPEPTPAKIVERVITHPNPTKAYTSITDTVYMWTSMSAGEMTELPERYRMR